MTNFVFHEFSTYYRSASVFISYKLYGYAIQHSATKSLWSFFSKQFSLTHFCDWTTANLFNLNHMDGYTDSTYTLNVNIHTSVCNKRDFVLFFFFWMYIRFIHTLYIARENVHYYNVNSSVFLGNPHYETDEYTFENKLKREK